jgi:RNA polymerase sigma-70 factor (ECF subfamily)
VLGFSAAEIAAVMETSVASVNSALQRARRLVAERVPAESQQRALRRLDDARLREVVTGYATALERGDADALVAMLTEDVTWAMPPMRHWYRGLAAVTDFAVALPLTTCGRWRHVPAGANGQPAVATYLQSDGAGPYRGWSVDVLTLRLTAEGLRIAAVTSFVGTEHHAAFGLPAALD